LKDLEDLWGILHSLIPFCWKIYYRIESGLDGRRRRRLNFLKIYYRIESCHEDQHECKNGYILKIYYRIEREIRSQGYPKGQGSGKIYYRIERGFFILSRAIATSSLKIYYRIERIRCCMAMHIHTH